ncbi:MAG: TylF/MycF family methyltransferase [Bacteroidetes bacterium]|uniref:TylF/MycF/NovP-related O-methyltransferase n=1 Tax=Phnomibacter sp. TaxID=2836217 RepID=UPI002FDEE990|nr:TylF/MycF family methyltransferase [Bacteroidota bacterium]
MVIKLANKVLGKLGYVITKKQMEEPVAGDMMGDEPFMELYQQVKPYTMTSPERLYALHKAVLYTIEKNLPGDFVECGVWRGGSSMMIALTLKQLGVQNRHLYLYDTFEGMSEPTEADKDLAGGDAAQLLATHDKTAGIWAFADLQDVQQNMQLTGYPTANIHYVQGKVEDTIPATIPAAIALLRLDTDWYESTKHELEHLYPLLAPQGALIIDDFGHWQGAKKAVLEYFDKQPVLLNRIDYTGRILIKTTA